MNSRGNIVYIISLGHSGSTLLGNILGTHNEAIHIGEFIAPLQRKIDIKCQTCNGNSCPVWGRALKKPYVQAVYNAFVTNLRGGSFQKFFNKPKNLYSPIFKEFQDLSFVIDSSKNISWVKYNFEKFSKFDYKIIFLYRDLRAVWASNVRKYPQIKTEKELMQIGKNIEAILTFQKQMEKNGYVIHYEELIEQPEKVISGLSEFIGINYEERMLHYYDYLHHTLGSNRNTLLVNKEAKKNNQVHIQEMNPSDKHFYNDIRNGFKLDERWKIELNENDLKMFNRVLGETQKRLGY